MTDSPFQHPGGTIKLQNPERGHFATYIFGNALHCDKTVQSRSHEGKTVVICGAGPTLRDTAAKWCPKGDEVWGCNSAAIWLHAQGHKVTHAFTVDQTPHMVVEWLSAPDLGYLLASTVHPHLTEYLLSKGRDITWFHNYVGVDGGKVAYAACTECDWMGDAGTEACEKCGGADVDDHTASYEEWLYTLLYPETVVVGSGLNAVTRAVDLAMFMGFEKIIVLGADCALQTTAPPPNAAVGSPLHQKWLREHTVMHADGGHALASNASCLTLEAEIDGRYWLAKPDLLVTAVWLVKMKRLLGSRLSIIGDTLPKALMNKPDEYLARLPALTDVEGKVMDFCLPEYLLDPPAKTA